MHVQLNDLVYHPTQESMDDQSVFENDSENVLYKIANTNAAIHITKHARRRYPSHAY